MVAAAASASLAGCVHAPKPTPLAATASTPACPTSDQHPTAELVFARVSSDTTGPGVSEADFSRFVSGEITPRFRDGLTVVDAQDLKPRPAGEIFYGPSKVVMIVLPGHPDDEAQIDAIRTAYTSRFKQQTLLEMTRQDCVSY